MPPLIKYRLVVNDASGENYESRTVELEQIIHEVIKRERLAAEVEAGSPWAHKPLCNVFLTCTAKAMNTIQPYLKNWGKVAITEVNPSYKTTNEKPC